MSGKGRGILGQVRDGSEDPREGPGRFVGLLGMCGKGRGILGQVRDGSVDPPEGPDGL